MSDTPPVDLSHWSQRGLERLSLQGETATGRAAADAELERRAAQPSKLEEDITNLTAAVGKLADSVRMMAEILAADRRSPHPQSAPAAEQRRGTPTAADILDGRA